ncbi:unnamed protein product [[Candida] boidinii]|nr:unnamed protein product [[Candida] boidinii]
MSGPSGFAVDVPITDLDHDEDNFSFLDDDETINENNNNNRNHSLDVSNLGSNNSSSFFYRGFEDFIQLHHMVILLNCLIGIDQHLVLMNLRYPIWTTIMMD